MTTKDTSASSSQVRLHSQPPQVPNKSPRLDSPTRRVQSDTAHDGTDGHGKTEPVLTPRQAAAAAQSKRAPRADSREQRVQARTTSRGSGTSGSPRTMDRPREQKSRKPDSKARRSRSKPTYLGKKWRQDVDTGYQLQRPGRSPQRPYQDGYETGSSQSEEIMFKHLGKAARAIYMDDVDRIDTSERPSYFTQRHIRCEEEPRRAQSLTVKSPKTRRPTWKPKRASKEPTDDPPPTQDQKEKIEL